MILGLNKNFSSFNVWDLKVYQFYYFGGKFKKFYFLSPAEIYFLWIMRIKILIHIFKSANHIKDAFLCIKIAFLEIKFLLCLNFLKKKNFIF